MTSIDWQPATLGELVTSHWSGYSFRSDDYTEAGVPVLTKGDVKPRGRVEHGTRFVDPTLVKKKAIKLTTPLDLLVTTRDLTTAADFLGLVAKAPASRRFAVNQGVTVFRVDDSRVDRDYLAYWCEGPAYRGYVKGHFAGATQIHIRHADLMAAPVLLPDRSTQQRIASILSAYDDLIENNTRRIALLEEMARRIYEEWFVHFRFPGHEGVRMVESELGFAPEGWATVRMEDICTRITDGSHYSPTSVEGGKPMASVKDMHDWGISVASCRRIAEDEYEKLVRNDCKPRLHDVLIAKDGSYLKHTFVVDEEIDLVILSSIAILRPNGRMLPNQLAMYLRLSDVASRMKGYVSGVAIPRIVLRDFRQFLVLLPRAEVQKEWARLCDPMLSLCRLLVRKNENLRATRDLLLPKLISGELDVSEAPAAELAAA